MLSLGLSLTSRAVLGRIIGGVVPPVLPSAPIVAPGPAYTGAAGSGFGGSPPVATGTALNGRSGMGLVTTATSTANAGWIYTADVYPEAIFDHDVTVIVRAGIDPDAVVTLNVEGNAVTCATRVPVEIDARAANGALVKRTVYEFGFRLRAADYPMTGPVEMYATASINRANSGVADRVIGPLRLYRQAAPDKTILWGPSLANSPATGTATTLQQALNYAGGQPSGQYALLANEDMVVDLPSSGWVLGSNYNARRGRIVISANGKNVTLMKSGAFGTVRPSQNGIAIQGFKMDLANFNWSFESPAGQGNAANFIETMLVGNEVYSSAGASELPGDGINTGQPRTIFQFVGHVAHVATWAHDVYEGDVAGSQVGCLRERRGGDCAQLNNSGHGTTAILLAPGRTVAYNLFREVNIGVLQAPNVGITLHYTGAGVARAQESGARNSAARTLTLTVDGTTVGTPLVASTAIASGTYQWSQVAAAINAQLGASGWVATPVSDARRFAGFGLAGVAEQTLTSSIIVGRSPATATPLGSRFFPHPDGVQFTSATGDLDNQYVVGNRWYDVFAQLLFLHSAGRGIWNCTVANNAGTLADEQGLPVGNGKAVNDVFSQILGNFIGLQYDHNSLPNQDVIVRAGATFDATSSITNNLARSISQSTAAALTNAATVAGNVAFYPPSDTGGFALTGSNVAAVHVLGSTPLASFPGLSAPTGDATVTPAMGSAVRGATATPRIARDLFGQLRPALAPAGAVA